MRIPFIVLCFLAWAMTLRDVGADSTPFLCKTLSAAEGDMIRTLQEDRLDFYGDAVAYVHVVYKGVNDAGIPQFRDEITVVRTPTPETSWKHDGIRDENRDYEVGISETRIIDRTMPTKPLQLRVLAVMEDGDLRYRWELPDGCD
jgi:hypothetical protein